MDSKSVSSHNPLQLIDSKLITQLWCFNNERMVEKQMSMFVQFGTANHREDDKCSYCINVTRFITVKTARFRLYYITREPRHSSVTATTKFKGFRLWLLKCLMCITFPYYIWMYTGVHLVISLEWGIHDLCILMGFDLRCESIM